MAIEGGQAGSPPVFVSSSQIVNFNRDVSIRRAANQFEDRFAEMFAPPVVLPIPDDVEPMMARLMMQSKNGHSQLQVSQVNVHLATNYTADYQTDLDARLKYAQDRLVAIFDLLPGLNLQPTFVGVNTTAHVVWSGAEDDDFLRRAFKACLGAVPNDIYEGSQKLTFELESRFFKSVRWEIGRIWDPMAAMSTLHQSRLLRQEATRRVITVVTDFNDRLSFHSGSTYYTDKDRALEVLERGFREGAAEATRICDALYV